LTIWRSWHFSRPSSPDQLCAAKELLPQFAERAGLSNEDGARASLSDHVGLIKKIAIANFIGNNLVDRVFDQPPTLFITGNAGGNLCYALQIYCDFSGYSDIAIGSAAAARVQAADLIFNVPYQARSLPDFWRAVAYHAFEWLRDYLYPSFGGLRKRRFKFIPQHDADHADRGLWHGAAWSLCCGRLA